MASVNNNKYNLLEKKAAENAAWQGLKGFHKYYLRKKN
jgi:hypothetical protein